MLQTRLDKFNNSWYQPGSSIKRLLWYFVNEWLFNVGWFPISSVKCAILRLFGAKIGRGVVIKPHVNIKYPWFLCIGDYSWIGESVWIDNLGQVDIGAHVCLSQGAMLLCGSHDYKKSAFDLLVKPITIEDGAWIGAQALVCPGVSVKTHAVLAAQSVATSDLEAYCIYQGNPAQKKRQREILNK